MKVSLLIWNPQNHSLLAELLRDECEVLPRERDIFAFDADLLIVDGPALATSGQEIRRAKVAAEPLFLPVLFIASRPDVTRGAGGVWEIIDDVITRPLMKREIQSRIRTLLRARRLSLRLHESLVSEKSTNEELLKTRMMYEREHLIADRLQHAALPNTLPHVSGFEFDGFYSPAGNEANVGGDWYDAVCLNDGRIVVSIGDVAGAGLEAAVTMASVRQAIRAVSQIYADPMTILDAADRMLKEEQPGRIVTAFVGVVDPISNTMTYASAGHPPPLLRTPEGSLVELRAQSLPLGLRVRGDGANVVTHIPPGCVVVLFTDGLSEVTRDLFEGERRLHAAVLNTAILRSEHPAADIKHAVYDGEPHGDDVAILTLRATEVPDEAGVHRWRLNSEDNERAAQIRGEFVSRLRAHGASTEALFSCELIFGELLGNVVRYARGELEIVLDVAGSNGVLHFLDKGKGFTLIPRLPTDLLSERGRGLFLIWTLSEDFNVDVRPNGGAHARVVLPVKLCAGAGKEGFQAREPVPQVRSCGPVAQR